jgi:hypothetical protein
MIYIKICIARKPSDNIGISYLTIDRKENICDDNSRQIRRKYR